MSQQFVERFESLSKISAVRHLFIRRIPGIDVAHDKAEALKRLDKIHREIRDQIGMGSWPLLTAEQIHGDRIAIACRAVASRRRVDKLGTSRCDAPSRSNINGRRGAPSPPDEEFAGCDAIITNQRHVALGIYVADCCAVYVVDPKTPAIGLVHSGKKGTERAIVSKAIEQMHQKFGSQSVDLLVQLSPCIRPPHYEIDFAAKIIEQCRSSGVRQVDDCGICTACDLDRYYSYRAEKGKTGRMLALLGLL